MMNTIINVLKKKKRNLPLAQMTGREDWSGSFATYKTNSKIKVTINYLSSCWGEKKILSWEHGLLFLSMKIPFYS